MKRGIRIVILLMAIAVFFPIANYYMDQKAPTPQADALQGSPLYKEAGFILEKKCVHCHGTPAQMPFYAGWPVAKSLISHDIAMGQESFKIGEVLAPEGGRVSEVTLSKLEYVLVKKTMPILPYVLLHWRNVLTANEEQALLDWIHDVRARDYATGDAAPEFRNEAVQPIPMTLQGDVQKAELGNKLYHDVRLSGDNTISCVTCHALDKGGTDQAVSSTGIHGQVGSINAPTVYNAVFQIRQFWDGRAADLKEQAGGPVLNPIEMGGDWKEVIPKLEADPAFVAEFTAVYFGGITSDSVQDAIAEFEKTLITPNSPFDRYLRGDKSALSPEAIEGYELFKDKGCVTCHTGKLLGGQSFEKMGLKKDYFADRGDIKKADLGRYNFTKKEEDKYKFKVPTLRNLELTFPYFHDGTAKTMEDAVSVMGHYQLENGLTQAEVARIVAFLKSLTGEYEGRSLSVS